MRLVRIPRVITQSRHHRARGSFDNPVTNVMRPGPWGNPYVVGVNGERGECIALYEEWLRSQYELLQERWRLRGHDLECCCAPRPCHGDILLRVAAFTPDQLLDWMLGFPPLDDL